MSNQQFTLRVMQRHFSIWLWLTIVTLLTGCSQQVYINTKQVPVHPDTTQLWVAPGNSVVGHIFRLKPQEGDTLADIARHFTIGLQAIQDANPGIDLWLPPTDREIILPLAFILPDAPREGIVINLPAMRLFHFQGKGYVATYPVGIGRTGWRTPLGQTRIVQKKSNPSWVVPVSIRREHADKGDPLPKVVPPGPDNPLGKHALRLGFPSYLIHGTNKPYGVGLRISHGCIRLYPENIAKLFPEVEVGTPVTIVDQPYLLGWWGKQLYLEAHPPLQRGKGKLVELNKRLIRIERAHHVRISWEKVSETITESRGIPIPVLEPTVDFERLIDQAPLAPHPAIWPHSPNFPALSEGWYVEINPPLTSRASQKMVAILRHQAPPLPAHLIGDRVLIGPYQHKRSTLKIRKRLKRELQLESRLLPPQQSSELTDMTTTHSL